MSIGSNPRGNFRSFDSLPISDMDVQNTSATKHFKSVSHQETAPSPKGQFTAQKLGPPPMTPAEKKKFADFCKNNPLPALLGARSPVVVPQYNKLDLPNLNRK